MTTTVFEIAVRNLGPCRMESSARLCMEDAVRLKDEGKMEIAEKMALKSLGYTVGIMHPEHKLALKLVNANLAASAVV